MKPTSILTRILPAAFLAAVAFATPASAHESPVGDQGPFKVEMITPDPAGIESRWGNGEVEFHVEPGTELIVIGLEKEQMVKVDKEGNMFANENSPSWWANQPEGQIPANATASAEPNWVWKMGGGSLQFHDHRFHFMDGSIDPATADGSVIFEFGLPILVNGEATELRGNLVFDSTLDPAAADKLKENAVMDAGTMTTATQESSNSGGSSSTGLIIGIIALVVVAGGAGAWFIRRK
jgi:hypothetical protein